jgi:hypothetical protein
MALLSLKNIIRKNHLLNINVKEMKIVLMNAKFCGMIPFLENNALIYKYIVNWNAILFVFSVLYKINHTVSLVEDYIN